MPAMTPEPIIISVTGNPIGKGRARATVVRGRGGKIATSAKGAPIIRHYTPEKTRAWEQDARTTARIVMQDMAPLAGPVSVVIAVVMAIPPSWPAWKAAAAEAGEVSPTTKPDIDNIAKAAKDALNGVVWVDDAQVVETSQSKRYGRTPGVTVSVFPIMTAPAQITRRIDLQF